MVLQIKIDRRWNSPLFLLEVPSMVYFNHSGWWHRIVLSKKSILVMAMDFAPAWFICRSTTAVDPGLTKISSSPSINFSRSMFSVAVFSLLMAVCLEFWSSSVLGAGFWAVGSVRVQSDFFLWLAFISISWSDSLRVLGCVAYGSSLLVRPVLSCNLVLGSGLGILSCSLLIWMMPKIPFGQWKAGPSFVL